MKRINLLPYSERQESLKKIEVIFIFFVVLFFNFVLLGLLNTVISHQLQKLNSYKNLLVSQLRETSLSIKNLQQVKQQFDQLQAAKNILLINHEKIRKVLILLKDLELLTPPRFFIKTISYELPYLSLIGEVQSEDNFLKLIKKLEKKYYLKFKCKNSKNKNLLFEFMINIKV